jgi:uncharacterized protein
MCNSTLLNALLPRTRRLVLAILWREPDRWWYLSDLAREMGVRPSTLQREVASLAGATLLEKRHDGGRVYYRSNRETPIFDEIGSLLRKSDGLVDVLRDALSGFQGAIELAFIYGSVADGKETSGSDVDLMVVGEVRLIDLVAALRRAERQVGRAINVTLFSPADFRAKRLSGNPFLESVLASPLRVLIGTGDGLA